MPAVTANPKIVPKTEDFFYSSLPLKLTVSLALTIIGNIKNNNIRYLIFFIFINKRYET